MRIEINNKSWYAITDFDSYEEIEELGEVTGTSGIPDCIDLERDWDEIQEYLGLSGLDQQIVMAYAEATDNDNWHADWGMEISIPDGVAYTADDVGKVMQIIMRRLTTARIEHA